MSLPTSKGARTSPDNTPCDQCFHYGETVHRGANYEIDISGQARAMCCPGCRVVAGLIASGGMASFYEHMSS